MLLHELFGNVPATAPLYHFTTLRNFYLILKSDTLKAKGLTDKDLFWAGKKAISFTRDPRRAFLPGNISQEGIGFRIDRNKIASRYKITPIKRGTSRFESEERVNQDIPNFSKYITGIVVPKAGKYTNIQMPDVINLAMSILDMSDAFPHPSRQQVAQFAREIRSKFFDTIRALNVPIIFGGKEYSVDQVDKAIGRIYWMRKSDPEQFKKLFNQFYHVNPRGEREMFGNVAIGKGKGTPADFMGRGEL